MRIHFLGAARTVTGSCYVIETDRARFAIDCGLHQGPEDIEARNRALEYDPKKLDGVLTTHAHIDHAGLLPRMGKLGFRGSIYATAPTRDLLEIMLLDSAHIQETEAEQNNRKNRRRGKKPVEPLYTEIDASAVMPFFRTVEYNAPFSPFPGVEAVYKDAGHILGSAFIELTIQENGTSTKLLFSGDLGRPDALLVNDPSRGGAADYLFLESTYGDRDHKNVETSRDELAEAIATAYHAGEKVVIPAFAVERTQEVLYCLRLLHKANRLPKDMPIYVDSPLAIKATKIFRKYPEYLDEETNELLKAGEDPLDLPMLRFTQGVNESQAINTTLGPAVVIAASGMCNAGRIKHHLKHNLWREGAAVVFVGFQAQGTPGRKLVDGAEQIKILGEEVKVRAKIHTIGGFSAHSGQSQILSWLDAMISHNGKRPMVYLIHGEPKAQDTLSGLIRSRFGLSVHAPDYLERVDIAPAAKPVEIAPKTRTVDWDFLLAETEGRIEKLKARLQGVRDKSFEAQVEIRDRLVDVNAELMQLISEL